MMKPPFLLTLRKGVDGFSLFLINQTLAAINVSEWSFRFRSGGRIELPPGTEIPRIAPNYLEVAAVQGRDTPARMHVGRRLLELLLEGGGTVDVYDHANRKVFTAGNLLTCYEGEVRNAVNAPTRPRSAASVSPASAGAP